MGILLKLKKLCLSLILTVHDFLIPAPSTQSFRRPSESLPPASPSEIIRFHGNAQNGRQQEKPLPRRKSRMPFGERLSLVQYNNPEPAPEETAAESEQVDPVEELKRLANCTLPPIEPEKQLRCIMDCILPPR